MFKVTGKAEYKALLAKPWAASSDAARDCVVSVMGSVGKVDQVVVHPCADPDS
jgi:hypothetical protein